MMLFKSRVTLTTWHHLSAKVGTNFVDKRWWLGRYTSISDSGHGVKLKSKNNRSTERYRGQMYIDLYINYLKRITVAIYTTDFNKLKLRILPTQYICVFRMILTINIDYSRKQH
jgi:hypothetical protein